MLVDGEITPRKGVGNILLGMSKKEVENLIGDPLRETSKKNDRTEADYEGFSIIYSPEDFILQIEFYPESNITYEGEYIFKNKNVWKKMVTDDGEPFEISGVVVLLRLGVSMWGMDEDEEFDKSLTLFVDGTFDHLKNKFLPYTQES